MGYLVSAGILGVLTVICLLVALFGPKEIDGESVQVRAGFGLFTGILVLVLGVLTVSCSITTVPARSIGIQTAFGKYSGTVGNGLHFLAPWSSIETFSTQVQYLDLSGNGSVPVTFKGGGGGSVEATPRWRIDSSKAEDLWKRYKTFEHVRDQLVNSSAKDSIRVVVSNYSPNDARSGENLRAIEDKVRADLSASLADDGVIIDSISIKAVSLDQRAQESLDKIVTANNDIERAKAEQERARIDAETAKIREQSGSLAPSALARYCLEVVNNWNDDKNGPLPAGFSCLGSSNQFVVTSKG